MREGLKERMDVASKLNHSVIQNSIIISSQTERLSNLRFVYDRCIQY